MTPLPALKGWRIVELSASIAARACGRLFAACGADVFYPAALQDGPFGQWLDQHKKPARANALRDAALVIAGPHKDDIEAARQAIAATGSNASLLALTWFDTRGPYAHLSSSDALMQGLTAVAYSFGKPEGPPILPQGHAPQLVSGLVGYIAGVSALMMPAAQRPKQIDMNVFEAALCFAEPGIVGSLGASMGSRRLGVNRFSPTYPCSIYRASDDWVGLTALTPAQWRSLCILIGRPELGHEPRFAATLQRLRAADEIDALLEPLFAKRAAAEWVADGITHRIPITPVPRPGGAPDMPHWQERGTFAPIAEGSDVRGPTLPFRMDFDGVTQTRKIGDLPLAGVRVVDFSMGWAGPLAARMFADLGADVVKIESQSHPDWWRSWEGRTSDDPGLLERARNFLDVNRGKRGALLDLATPEGLAAAKALIARADVVIENLGPGVMDRLGLGPKHQRVMRPGIISVTMGAFGAFGPLAGIRAYGSTVEQACGMPFVNGHEEWAPCLQHVAYGDPVAGLYAAAAVLTALAGRETCGGASIDLGQVECLFQLGADAIVNEQANGVQSARTGTRREHCAPCCVLNGSEADSWFTIAVETDLQWKILCGVTGNAAWAHDPAFATCAGRNAAAAMIEEGLAAWARGRAADDSVADLLKAGVPAGRVYQTYHLLENPQLLASDFWLEMDREFSGKHFTGATPFKFDGVRPMRVTPAPTMGQHTAEILAELSRT